MRAETGPMQFTEDWCGLFIRGDIAMCYAQALRIVLAKYEKGELPDYITMKLVRSLKSELASCDERDRTEEHFYQIMKPYQECLKGKKEGEND